MDVHNVITTAVDEVLHGVKIANEKLADVRVGDPTRIEIEFGINATYEIANYDDIRIATVRATIPILSGVTADASLVGPATAAMAKAEPEAKKPEKDKKKK